MSQHFRRSLLLFLISFFFCLHEPIAAQSVILETPGAPDRGLVKTVVSSPRIEAHGGAYLPLKGHIRGLVVFVQVRNDEVQDSGWPLGELPAWKDSYVQQLSQYFDDMSNGELELNLDVYPDLMVTQNTENGYREWGLDFGYAIKEIIDSLDVTIDFSLYDTWDSEGNAYALEEAPDGKVDLMIFAFRSTSNVDFLPWSGISDLGFAGYHFVDEGFDRFIYGGTGAWNDAGSTGLTLAYRPGYKLVMNEWYAFKISIHELGHKLFGEGHPSELYGGLGLMSNASAGYAMNSFERHLAGYMTYRELTPERDTIVTLRDYVTHNDAVLITVPDLLRSYYALEFRAKVDHWDTAPSEGLYIYRIYDSWSKNQKKVLVISAEGAYDWELDTLTNKIHPVRPSPLKGYNRLQRIPIDGKNYWAEGWQGTPDVAFNMSRSNFAVWKNPTPDFMFGSDTVETNLHIDVLDMTDSTVTVKISYQDPVILAADNPPLPGQTLGSPYPHPLPSGTRGFSIPVQLESTADARLLIFDALGRQLSVLHDGRLPAGENLLRIEAPDLQAGTYLLVFETPETRYSRLLIVSQ